MAGVGVAGLVPCFSIGKHARKALKLDQKKTGDGHQGQQNQPQASR